MTWKLSAQTSPSVVDGFKILCRKVGSLQNLYNIAIIFFLTSFFLLIVRRRIFCFTTARKSALSIYVKKNSSPGIKNFNMLRKRNVGRGGGWRERRNKVDFKGKRVKDKERERERERDREKERSVLKTRCRTGLISVNERYIL